MYILSEACHLLQLLKRFCALSNLFGRVFVWLVLTVASISLWVCAGLAPYLVSPAWVRHMNETLECLASAVRAGQLDAVSRLLDEDPTLLQSHDERRRQSLLMIAASAGHTALVSLLLELGADVNPCEQFGFTSLHFAAHGGYSEIVCALLKHGAGAGVRDDDLYTPLMYVAMKCDMQAMHEALIHLKPEDINGQTVEGYTALYMACKYGRAEQAAALLWAGADHTIADQSGVTPRDVARRRSHRDCVARLDMWVWQRELPYLLHRARCLHDLQAKARDSSPSTHPMYTAARVAAGQPLPEVTVLHLQEANKGRAHGPGDGEATLGGGTGEATEPTAGAEARQGKGEEAEAEARQGKGGERGTAASRQNGKLPERDAVFSFVVRDLPGDLYLELLEGLRVS